MPEEHPDQLVKEFVFASGKLLQIVKGDITLEDVDAIVNAANSHLQHGGGVAGTILQRGGIQVQEESNAWVKQYGPVSNLEPAYTSAGNLKCRYIIHAVGPVWGEGDEDSKLRAAVCGSLKRADFLQLRTIAFPAISTGIFGFPKERAADIILNSIQDYFSTDMRSSIEVVRLVLYDQPTLDAFSKALENIFIFQASSEENGTCIADDPFKSKPAD